MIIGFTYLLIFGFYVRSDVITLVAIDCVQEWGYEREQTLTGCSCVYEIKWECFCTNIDLLFGNVTYVDCVYVYCLRRKGEQVFNNSFSALTPGINGKVKLF